MNLLLFLSFVLLIYSQNTSLSASGKSDGSYEQALIKARYLLTKQITLLNDSGKIENALFLKIKSLGDSAFNKELRVDTLSKDPLIVEYFAKLSLDINKITKKEIAPKFKPNLYKGNDQQKNIWVSSSNEINDVDFYYGIGKSKISQDEANKYALLEFAQNVETKVNAIFETKKLETNSEFSSEKKYISEVATQISLKGVKINETFFNDSIYYSFIYFNKDDYSKSILLEQKRDFELEILKKEQELLRQKKESELSLAQEELKKEKLKNQALQLENEANENANLLKKYDSFLKIVPHSQLISISNGELSANTFLVNFSYDFTKEAIRSSSISYKLSLLEIAGKHLIEEQSEINFIRLKLQILPSRGSFNKLSIAIGYQSFTNAVLKEIKNAKFTGSFFLAGNVSFPEFYHTIASTYIDAYKITFAGQKYLFFDTMQDAIAVISELNFILDSKFATVYNDKLIFNFGLQFKASDFLTSSFVYQDNQSFLVKIDIGF